MPHCATLNDYRFESSPDDIRGSRLLSQEGKELGKIRDVVFEHATGEIRYMVVVYGRERCVLVPLERVFRGRRNSFESDLSGQDLDRLPAFEVNILHSDRQWRSYEQLHQMTLDAPATPRSNLMSIRRPADAGMGPKWNGFCEQIRRDLHGICGRCERCEERDFRAA